MTPEERKQVLESASGQFWALRAQLERVWPELQYEMDRKVIRGIMTQCTWATENCCVVGKHQIGEALDDTMGLPGELR